MNLLLVITSLARGGAERVLSHLANGWAAQGHQVTLLTLAPQALDVYPLHPAVRRIAHDLHRSSDSRFGFVQSNVRRLRVLRRAVRRLRPDVVVSFEDVPNVLTLLALRGLPVPALISQRCDPRYHRIGAIQEYLRQKTYPRAQTLVVQTETVRTWAEAFMPPGRTVVIPNPVPIPPAPPENSLSPELPSPCLVAMGRLHPQKGFDLLIEAFAVCLADFPDWHLAIFGEGEEKVALLRLIEARNVGANVRLMGITDYPPGIFCQAEIFVLSSRYEGFPNALLEAMAAGLPVVSFDCPSGPSDIIRPGIDGLLVPPGDVPALTQALSKLMADRARREQMGTRAQEVRERFSLPSVLAQWDAAIEALGVRR